jgi:hypothetical protein
LTPMGPLRMLHSRSDSSLTMTVDAEVTACEAPEPPAGAHYQKYTTNEGLDECRA